MIAALRFSTDVLRCASRLPSRSLINIVAPHQRYATFNTAKLLARNYTKAYISKQLQYVFVRRHTNSSTPEKGKKMVGYWLLGCGGMVFVAVILGGTLAYASLVVAICTVLSTFLPRTVK